MTESLLTRQLARWRVAYATSPLRRFLSWWGRELVVLVPPRVRDWFADRREVLLAQLEGTDLLLAPVGASDGQRIELAADPEAARAAVVQALDRGEETPAVIFALPAERVLRRQLTLPAAAEENLRQVLGFELDRQTPFKADQVYYDARVAVRDPATRQIVVDLTLAPRGSVDAGLAQLEAAGVPLDGLDALIDGRPLGFNLLPAQRRAPRRKLWLHIALALGAVALGLLFLVMGQSVTNREAALERLRAETESSQTEARSVAELRRLLKDAIDGANFLAERKRDRPANIDVLLDTTQRLPNDTWLQRFSINGEQVQLQGQSREAAGLITVLQKSPYLEGPALQGAITPDARTGKEQFLIAAKLRQPASSGDAPDKTPAKAPKEKGNAVAARG
jgi:general secretion pathway protein L